MTARNHIAPASTHARTGGNTRHATRVQFNNPLPSEYPFVLNCGSPSVTVTQATEQREGNGHGEKKGGNKKEKRKTGGPCSVFYLGVVSIVSISTVPTAPPLSAWSQEICFGHDACIRTSAWLQKQFCWCGETTVFPHLHEGNKKTVCDRSHR